MPQLPTDVRPATALFKALADDNRLRMIALLAQGEACVCHLASALDLTQPNASQHLAVLKHAGVVDSERRGSWIYYRLREEADPLRAPILRAVLDGFAAQREAAEDRERLSAAQVAQACL